MQVTTHDQNLIVIEMQRGVMYAVFRRLTGPCGIWRLTVEDDECRPMLHKVFYGGRHMFRWFAAWNERGNVTRNRIAKMRTHFMVAGFNKAARHKLIRALRRRNILSRDVAAVVTVLRPGSMTEAQVETLVAKLSELTEPTVRERGLWFNGSGQ